MKKTILVLLMCGLCLAAASTAAAQARGGQAVIFLNSGGVVADRVVDISSTRHVLQTAGNGEFPLADVWMINYVENQWNYPDERNQMTANEHYVFLRSGGIIAGRITDFSSTRFVYQLRGGQEVAPANISRIYFSSILPAVYQNQLQNQGNRGNRGNRGNANNLVSIVSGTYRAIGRSLQTELALGTDGSAVMTTILPTGRTVTSTGTWQFHSTDSNVVIVRVRGAGLATAVTEMTFGRNANDLIGLTYDKNLYGELRLRKQ